MLVFIWKLVRSMWFHLCGPQNHFYPSLQHRLRSAAVGGSGEEKRYIKHSAVATVSTGSRLGFGLDLVGDG